MRISDWSSDVCSSDLHVRAIAWRGVRIFVRLDEQGRHPDRNRRPRKDRYEFPLSAGSVALPPRLLDRMRGVENDRIARLRKDGRSEEHTSELQSLLRISYAVFCLKKKTTNTVY